MRVILTSSCENLHLTETEMINPEIGADGSVTGYLGSDAHYCSVCGSSNMESLDVRQVF